MYLLQSSEKPVPINNRTAPLTSLHFYKKDFNLICTWFYFIQYDDDDVTICLCILFSGSDDNKIKCRV